MSANLRAHSSLSTATSERPVLYLALELGWEGWKLGFASGPGPAPRRREVLARDVPGLLQEIAEPGRFCGQADLPCLKPRALGFHPDKLVALWVDTDG